MSIIVDDIVVSSLAAGGTYTYNFSNRVTSPDVVTPVSSTTISVVSSSAVHITFYNTGPSTATATFIAYWYYNDVTRAGANYQTLGLGWDGSPMTVAANQGNPASIEDAWPVYVAYDSPTRAGLDAFGRQRVSSNGTLFASKQIYTNQPNQWDDQQISGSGTSSTYNTNRASSTLGVSANTAGVRARQSKQWMDYQSGKSQLIFSTFVMGAASTGITRRVGLFETNNGLYLEQTNSGVSFVKRSYVSGSVVNTSVAQADWNVDTFDGSGPSGVTLDLSKAQILIIDFEWLGVGSVRFGFVVNGSPYYAHIMYHANASTSVYMSTPNLPVRYEISNDGSGGAATLECICSAVSSETERILNGVDYTVDRDSTAFTTLNNASIYPLIAIRLQSGRQGVTVIPGFLSVICSTNAIFKWALLINPTFSGTALAYSAVTNSNIEACTTATNGTTVTGGRTVISGYIQASQQVGITIQATPDIFMGTTIAGVSDIFVLAVQRLTGTTEAFYGSLGWHELI